MTFTKKPQCSTCQEWTDALKTCRRVAAWEDGLSSGDKALTGHNQAYPYLTNQTDNCAAHNKRYKRRRW